MTEYYDIIWKENNVGRIENAIPDSWYLEGNWVSNNSPSSREFEKLIASFDPKQIDKDPTKGTKVILKSGDTDTHGLIYSLENGKIFLRQVFRSEAVEWLLKNVK